MWVNYNNTDTNINTDLAKSISKELLDGVYCIKLVLASGTLYLKFISEAERNALFDTICSSNVNAVQELVSVDGTPPPTINEGDKCYDPTDKKIYTADADLNWIKPVEPTSSAIYVCTEDMHMYRWTGSAMIDTTQYLSYTTKEEAELGSDNIKVMTSKRVSEAIDYQIGLCETASNGSIKTVSCKNFSLATGSEIRVRFTNANSVRDAIEINVAGTGVKPLLINGLPSSSTNYEIPASTYLLKYDGTNWNIITQAALPINLGGTNAVNVNDALKNLIQDAQAIIEDSDLTLPVLSIKSTVSEGAKILVSDLITKYKAILSDLTSISTVTDKIVTPDTISQVIKAITDDINDIGDLLDNTIEDLSDLSDDVDAIDARTQVFTGATITTDGSVGIIPAPTKDDYNRYLRGDGTWDASSGGGDTVKVDEDDDESGYLIEKIIGAEGSGISVSVSSDGSQLELDYSQKESYLESVEAYPECFINRRSCGYGRSIIASVLNLQGNLKLSDCSIKFKLSDFHEKTGNIFFKIYKCVNNVFTEVGRTGIVSTSLIDYNTNYELPFLSDSVDLEAGSTYYVMTGGINYVSIWGNQTSDTVDNWGISVPPNFFFGAYQESDVTNFYNNTSFTTSTYTIQPSNAAFHYNIVPQQ